MGGRAPQGSRGAQDPEKPLAAWAAGWSSRQALGLHGRGAAAAERKGGSRRRRRAAAPKYGGGVRREENTLFVLVHMLLLALKWLSLRSLLHRLYMLIVHQHLRKQNGPLAAARHHRFRPHLLMLLCVLRYDKPMNRDNRAIRITVCVDPCLPWVPGDPAPGRRRTRVYTSWQLLFSHKWNTSHSQYE